MIERPRQVKEAYSVTVKQTVTSCTEELVRSLILGLFWLILGAAGPMMAAPPRAGPVPQEVGRHGP